MKQNVTFSIFLDTFKGSDERKDQFSYNGLRALYEFLIDYEDGTGKDLEFDMVALCCEYTEYEDVEDFLKNYSDGFTTFEEFKEGNTGIDYSEEELKTLFRDMIIQQIEEKTQIILIPGETSFIIQDY